MVNVKKQNERKSKVIFARVTEKEKEMLEAYCGHMRAGGLKNYTMSKLICESIRLRLPFISHKDK